MGMKKFLCGALVVDNQYMYPATSNRDANLLLRLWESGTGLKGCWLTLQINRSGNRHDYRVINVYETDNFPGSLDVIRQTRPETPTETDLERHTGARASGTQATSIVP